MRPAEPVGATSCCMELHPWGAAREACSIGATAGTAWACHTAWRSSCRRCREGHNRWHHSALAAPPPRRLLPALPARSWTPRCRTAWGTGRRGLPGCPAVLPAALRSCTGLPPRCACPVSGARSQRCSPSHVCPLASRSRCRTATRASQKPGSSGAAATLRWRRAALAAPPPGACLPATCCPAPALTPCACPPACPAPRPAGRGLCCGGGHAAPPRSGVQPARAAGCGRAEECSGAPGAALAGAAARRRLCG